MWTSNLILFHFGHVCYYIFYFAFWLNAFVSKFRDAFSGRQQEPLEWSARQKIAVGAARGLRYLHEECRVGCIVHRDMRPNNILITHDFEPLVWKLPIFKLLYVFSIFHHTQLWFSDIYQTALYYLPLYISITQSRINHHKLQYRQTVVYKKLCSYTLGC